MGAASISHYPRRFRVNADDVFFQSRDADNTADTQRGWTARRVVLP